MPRSRKSPAEVLKEREAERKRQLWLCAKDVSALAKKMLEGKDLEKTAASMMVTPGTFRDKVRRGRFSAAELYYMAGLCGYKIEGNENPHIEGMLDR